MGLKKILLCVACFLCLFSLAITSALLTLKTSVNSYLVDLTLENEESDVVLLCFSERKPRGNLKSFKNRGNWTFVLPAYYDDNIYMVRGIRHNNSRYVEEICVDAINSEGVTTKCVNLGVFGEEGVYRNLYDFALFNKEWYYNTLTDPEELRRCNLVRYSNGCIYVRDVDRTVKYDIKKDEIIENPPEAAEVFTINYIYSISDDWKTITITNLKDSTQKDITLDIIAEACPEIKAIVTKYSKKRIIGEGYFTDYPFFDISTNYQFLKEIDGVLYLTVTFRDKIGFEYPVVLKFDYDAETFEFCVAGDYDTAMIPIPIVK